MWTIIYTLLLHYIAALPTSEALEKKPHLLMLVKELEVLSQQWRDMGDYLELSEDSLVQVERQCGPTPSRCMKGMLKVWLSRETPPPTWRAILEVVEFLDSDLALKLKQKALIS